MHKYLCARLAHIHSRAAGCALAVYRQNSRTFTDTHSQFYYPGVNGYPGSRVAVDSPTYSHTKYDVTSYFESAFIEVRKNGRKFHIQWLWVKFLQYGLRGDHKIVRSHLRQSATYICRI